MDLQTFLEGEAYADMFDGEFVMRGFIGTILDGYDDKSDWRDFTAQERGEIIFNCHRMVEFPRQAEAR